MKFFAPTGTRYSAVAFAIATVALLPWTFIFWIQDGKEGTIKMEIYDKLDVTNLDVRSYVGF